MFDLYVQAKNALTSLESALRVTISNANNYNTPGFKYIFTSFTTLYNEPYTTGTLTQNPIQVGAGMTMGSTSTDFSQGTISIGTALDVAITGEGFMLLSSSPADFSSGSNKVYTRSGRFQVDLSNTYLVDAFGRKVYGYKLNENGDVADTTLVPIQTNGQTDIGFTDGGLLIANYNEVKTDPTVKKKPLYRLALTTFQNKQGLVLSDGASYTATAASGQQAAPGIAGSPIGGTVSTYGNILANSLESANIDVARVALDMNLLNRGFSATQGFIDNITKVLQGLLKIMGG